MNIDQRFLHPHPRTVLWAEQRKKCEACANLVRSAAPEEDPSMRCSAVKMADAVQPHKSTNPRFSRLAKSNKLLQGQAFCIDAREPKSPCGPDAILFRLSLPGGSD